MSQQRPEHSPNGDPCAKCGIKASSHRKRFRPNRPSRPDNRNRGNRHRVKPKQIDNIIGVDGEGQGRKPHKYTLLAAANERGSTWHVGDGLQSLPTRACLDFLLGLPQRSLVVGFAFLYDLTKILKDLPNRTLYLLFHEEKRAITLFSGRIHYKDVKWQGYSLNFMNRKFTCKRDGRLVVIWDIFRFFGCKFTQALIDWKIGTKEAIEAMGEMKDQRSNFDKLDANQIREYCFDECRHLATLARALIEAHKNVGLELKSYYGAGSTATALLNKISIKESIVPCEKVMQEAVACAFFGGRFENSHVGEVKGKVYNYDISSAYPYQTTFLPCLLHGTWRHQSNPKTGAIQRARLALVHWKLRNSASTKGNGWGPFPIRDTSGRIVFPKAALGGWTWKQEYLQAKKVFSNVDHSEAYLYDTDCDCQPFSSIPYYYNERCKLGKDGKGIVLKLGPNSVYGKLAQSKGLNPPFQCWVWAGNITSGCRGQLLSCFEGLKDQWHILMFATDGISSRVPLTLPKPKDTGTTLTGKPLGGWEEKGFPLGVFCVRPGIHFPLHPTDSQLKEVRARGLGKKALYQNWEAIQNTWKKEGPSGIHSLSVNRFIGAKSALTVGAKSKVFKRSENYGEWIEHTIRVSFNPLPKRRAIFRDGRLAMHDYCNWESIAYDAAMKETIPEAISDLRASEIAAEQPDFDFAEFDDDIE